MRMFSNDIRVANTASPSFQSQANVSQYGWTGADQGHYNQLIQYVDECRKIWQSMEEKIAYVEEILEQVEGVDAQIQYINLVAAEMTKWRTEVLAARDQVERMYEEVKPLYNQFQIDYTDFSKKYTNVVKLHGETVVAATSAATSETNAAISAQEAKDVAEELRKGQVYRGTWNIESNAAYPPKPDTNSVWDVVLNEGSLEFRFDNTLWYWGDRLLFLKDDDKFTQIEAGGSVTSVNGKKGAVTISYTDVHAAPEGFGLGGYGEPLSGKSANDTNGSGFYGVFSGTTETPYSAGGPSGSQLLNMEWGKAGATQLFSSYTSDRLHFRRKYQEVWQPWHEIYTTAKKPTPSELGALNKAGDTIEGNLNIGAGARLVLNSTVMMGANNSPFLRDHGNGNVTLSASSTSGGVAGDLYLGYTGAALSGTTGYNTRSVKLYAPMTWNGSGSTIVDNKGINSEFMQGPIRTEKDSANITHTIIGGTDTVNRGRTLIAGGECGKAVYDNTTTADEAVHIAGDANNGVFVHTGLQNGWAGSTHYQNWFNQGQLYSRKMDGTTTLQYYNTGFKPTATDVGALGDKGTQTLEGSLLINPGTSSDPISLTQTFNPTGANAQGISGYNSTDTKKRAWGVGAYSSNAKVEYAYLGVGEAPWSNGVKAYANRVEVNQPLTVPRIETVGGSIRSNTADVMSLDGKSYSFVTSPLDAHLCNNAYWNGANWAKYTDDRGSSYLVAKESGLEHFWSVAGETSPNSRRGIVLTGQNTGYVPASEIFEPAPAYGWTMNDDEMLAYKFPGGCELRGILRRNPAVTIGDKTIGAFRHPNCKIPYTILHIDVPTAGAPLGWAYTESVLSGSVLKGGGVEQTTGWIMVNIRVQYL